jgi:hypothetical protein
VLSAYQQNRAAGGGGGMIASGTLNGAPVGPQLPPSVPCPAGCQAPVWVAVDVAAASATGQLVAVDEVLELDLFPSGSPWAPAPWSLTPHRCRT